MTAKQRWTLAAAIVGSGVVFLDSTIVTVALPQIGEDLRTSRLGVLEAQSYVYSGYLLSLASLLILAGALSDYYGRRRLYTAGLVGFTVASLLGGLSVSMEMLIGARVLQGIAGAFLIPGSLAIITAAFDENEQGRAFGIWAGASAIATILGPFLGGVLVDLMSWRAAFLVNVPVLALGTWVSSTRVDESRDESASGKFDWIGAGIVAVAVGALGFGAIRGQESQWSDASALIGIGVGVAGLAAIPIWILRSPNPLVPPWLFRSRNFTFVNAATLVIYGALYVVFYFVPVYLQGALGYNAAGSGIALSSAMIFIAVFSPKFGRLAARYGPRRFMAGGSLVMGIGVLWLARIPSRGSAWLVELDRLSTLVPPGSTVVDILPGMIVFGIGAMMMVAPLTTAAMTAVSKDMAGLASALNNAVSRVGPQLATAAIFVVANSIFFGSLGDLAPDLDADSVAVRDAFSPLNAPAEGTPNAHVEAAAEASTDAFSFAMVVAAGLLMLGSVISYFGMRDPGDPSEAGTARRAVPGPIPACPPLDLDRVPDTSDTVRLE